MASSEKEIFCKACLFAAGRVAMIERKFLVYVGNGDGEGRRSPIGFRK